MMILSLCLAPSSHLTTRCAAPRLCALDKHAAVVADLHKRMAESSEDVSATATRESHNMRQKAVFTDAAAFFASEEATPDEVAVKLKKIATVVAGSCRRDKAPRVLDVGCGTGAMLGFYEDCGVDPAGVTGVDLCNAMLAYARKRFPAAKFIESDFVDVPLVAEVETYGYDVIVFNAVFGNLYDQSAALSHAAQLLRPSGTVVISHPLGARFVEELRSSDPTVVPHGLPTEEWLARAVMGPGAPLRLRSYQDGFDGTVYLAVLDKSASVHHLPLGLGGKLPALRGPVAQGFGRGSRKLGIPTANLPCSLFQEALAELPCGVYVGWTGIRGAVHKCVCNIGFSPTFAGEENPEKIVEAHIMAEFESDFYDEEMRLLLLGFIREERKFSGIEELLATINADIETAKAELDLEPLQALRTAPWLTRTGDEGAAALYLLDPQDTGNSDLF